MNNTHLPGADKEVHQYMHIIFNLTNEKPSGFNLYHESHSLRIDDKRIDDYKFKDAAGYLEEMNLIKQSGEFVLKSSEGLKYSTLDQFLDEKARKDQLDLEALEASIEAARYNKKSITISTIIGIATAILTAFNIYMTFFYEKSPGTSTENTQITPSIQPLFQDTTSSE